jgi:hypothetical protein
MDMRVELRLAFLFSVACVGSAQAQQPPASIGPALRYFLYLPASTTSAPIKRQILYARAIAKVASDNSRQFHNCTFGFDVAGPYLRISLTSNGSPAGNQQCIDAAFDTLSAAVNKVSEIRYEIKLAASHARSDAIKFEAAESDVSSWDGTQWDTYARQFLKSVSPKLYVEGSQMQAAASVDINDYADAISQFFSDKGQELSDWSSHISDSKHTVIISENLQGVGYLWGKGPVSTKVINGQEDIDLTKIIRRPDNTKNYLIHPVAVLLVQDKEGAIYHQTLKLRFEVCDKKISSAAELRCVLGGGSTRHSVWLLVYANSKESEVTDLARARVSDFLAQLSESKREALAPKYFDK